MTAETDQPIERRRGGDRRRTQQVRAWPAVADRDCAPETALELLVQRTDAEAQTLRAVAQALSHELRTPLTTIYSGSKLLNRHATRLPDAVVQDVSAAIEADAERLLRIVEDLVVAAALPGEQAIRGEPVLLHRLLASVARDAQRRWPDAVVVVDVPRQLPAVEADEVSLAQVLRNLLDNAAQFGPERGPIEVRAFAAGGRAEIHVLDDGPGVETDESEWIFRLFTSSGTRTRHGGLGMGLFVTRRLVGLMGGRVWVTPRPAGGADFGLDLPFYPADDA